MHTPGKKRSPEPGQPTRERPDLFLYFGENFEPYHDMVLVEGRFLEEVTGVEIPDEVKSKQMTAQVVRVGPGRMTESGVVRPPPCKEGDFVFALIGQGIPIKLGNRAFFLLQSSQVLGRFPDGPEKPKTPEMFSDMNIKCHCGHPEDPTMIHRNDMACFKKAQAEERRSNP
jgi:co-chaperonin GroES (HSP10)